MTLTLLCIFLLTIAALSRDPSPRRLPRSLRGNRLVHTWRR